MKSNFSYFVQLFLLLIISSCSKNPSDIKESGNNNLSIEIDTALLANGHDYVDLGICNGLCWATMNIGAERIEDRGEHFFWGEADIFKRKRTFFQLDFYTFGNPISKYVSIDPEYKKHGRLLDMDGKLTLEATDDAAQFSWGGGWRMPYCNEIDSLLALCSWQKVEINGIGGYKVTSKKPGYEDRSIFLPFTGAAKYTSIIRQNQGVYLWAKDMVDDACANAYGLVANEEYISRSSYARDTGQAIRAVFQPGEVLVEKVELDTTRLQLFVGDPTHQLSASVFPTNATRSHLYWFSSDYSVASVDQEGNISTYSPGWCYITAIATDGTSQAGVCRVEVMDPTPLSHECVNLGIGNLLRWATMDVGATSPEETGSLMTLEEARNHQWGDHWRLPTAEELESLRRDCKWEPEVLYGISGFRVRGMAHDTEKYSIFLPASSLYSIHSYWSESESRVSNTFQSIMSLFPDSAFWSYSPVTSRHSVRLVYSLGD